LIGFASSGDQKGMAAMPIDPAALAQSIGALPPPDLRDGFVRALQQVTDAAKTLFGAQAAGLMLADAEGTLRWAAASDQHAQTIQAGQEQLAQGPCATAFAQHAPAAARDAASDPAYRELAGLLADVGVRAALSVPVEVDGGLIGTLDVYLAQPHDWDASEVAALQTYAGVVGNLLASAAAAQVQGRLAARLQTALDHRVLIEQAKGVVMAREGVDAQAAFERLRTRARSSRRTVVAVAREVLAERLDGSRPRP
jgi:GAF domain-containing protein